MDETKQTLGTKGKRGVNQLIHQVEGWFGQGEEGFSRDLAREKIQPSSCSFDAPFYGYTV